jgi:HPt (histidine-containing phosphotransfer) domain-containing protein
VTVAAIHAGTLGELQAILGQERLDQLLGILATELATRPHIIRGALADQDFPRAAAEAHGLKGASASLGANSVAAAALLLEQAIAAARGGDRTRIAPALEALAEAVVETQHALAVFPRLAPLVASLG